MDPLWPWLLLVAAVGIVEGLVGESIGLAEPTTQSETTVRTRQGGSPIPFRDDLPVPGGYVTFTRGNTETALIWEEDATKGEASFPCSASTPATEETASVQVDSEESLEQQPPNPEELSLKEAPSVAPASRLRGIKSLVFGSLILGVLLLVMNAPDELDSEDSALTELRHFFAEDLIDRMFAIDDFLDTKVPVFPFKILSFWILVGAAPVLFFSGLENLARNLRRHRHGQAPPRGPRVPSLPLSLLSTLLSMWVVMLPAYNNAEDDESPLLEEVSVNIAWGVNIAYMTLLLF
ncbi:hypothetical protein, conserved [Eimeria maxima]|uniref:Uncharacterized protein n=1 Tax=Eimeria maxima TaxID=5804 RepID=U6MB15_EIMMA|nr:hypothetical protein, conserved [Eimeria maxima]CDJ60243.1 hypothetical protein, conserved [Eimeria maxima]